MQFLPARSHLSGSCQGEPQCSRVQTGLQQHTLSCTGYEASAACSRQSERQQGGRQLRQQACHSIQTVAPMQNTAQGKSADRRCQPAPPVHYTDASILFTSAEPPRSAPNMQAKASMLVVGLANSGKTSIVQALKAERSLDDTVPTVGFSVERFHMLNTMLTVVDMSGQPKYQKLWECYYDDVQVVGSLLHQRCRLHGACTFQAPADACTAQSIWLHAQGGAQTATHAAAWALWGSDTTADTWRLWCSPCFTAEVLTGGRAGTQVSAAAQGFCLHGIAVCHFQLLTWAGQGRHSPEFVTNCPKGAADAATLAFWRRGTQLLPPGGGALPGAIQQRR